MVTSSSFGSTFFGGSVQEIVASRVRGCRFLRLAVVALLVGGIAGSGETVAVAVNCPEICAARGRQHLGPDRPRYVGDLPSVLFRVELIEPFHTFPVFRDFVPTGTGISLVDHVLDGDPMVEPHGFISAIASPMMASFLAESFRRRGIRVWIYSLEPDEGFYNVSQSLDWIYENAQNPVQRNRASLAQHRSEGLEEWVAIGPVTSWQVREAWEVTTALDPAVDFREQCSTIITNPDFEKRDSRYVRPSRQLLNG